MSYKHIRPSLWPNLVPFIGQFISNNGDVRCIQWDSAFIAGGVGAIAGAAAPFVASWLGAAGLGSAANTVQFGITQYAHGQSVSGFGIAWNAATGGLGGIIAGQFVQPASLLFIENSPWLNSALARALNQQSQLAANTTLRSILRSLGGRLSRTSARQTAGVVDHARSPAFMRSEDFRFRFKVRVLCSWPELKL
jgi:hypothetical protein